GRARTQVVRRAVAATADSLGRTARECLTMGTAPRDLLRAMFDAAVAAADPAVVLPAHLPEPPRGRTVVVGAGKASAAMAVALERHWSGELAGLIVTRYGHAAPCRRIEVVEAAHPVPDEAGRAAAARILGLVQGLSADDLCWP